MTQGPSPIACTVTGGAKLEPGTATELSLCQAIRDALSGETGIESVAVTVISSSRASAVITLADGRQLPEVHVASSDGVLRASSAALLAKGLSAQMKTKKGE